MPTSQPGVSRHQLRAWLKSAIESGLLDRVPPRYDPDGSGDPQPTEDYARRLLAELKDPESSQRLLREILAEARQFREWVEYRQKMSRRIILGGWDSEGAAAWVPEPLDPARPDRVNRPTRPGRQDGGARPDADPMWDVWLDGSIRRRPGPPGVSEALQPEADRTGPDRVGPETPTCSRLAPKNPKDPADRPSNEAREHVRLERRGSRSMRNLTRRGALGLGAVIVLALLAATFAVWVKIDRIRRAPYEAHLKDETQWVQSPSDPFLPGSSGPQVLQTKPCLLKIAEIRGSAWEERYYPNRLALATDGTCHAERGSKGWQQNVTAMLADVQRTVAALSPSNATPSQGELILVGFADGGSWTTRIYDKNELSPDVLGLLTLLRFR